MTRTESTDLIVILADKCIHVCATQVNCMYTVGVHFCSEMTVWLSLLVPFALVGILVVPSLCQDAYPYTDRVCRTDVQYPPEDPKAKVPSFVLNLDLSPEERWRPLVKNKSAEVKALLNDLIDLLGAFFNETKVTELLDDIMAPLAFTLPQPYQDEILGIAESTGIPLGQIVLYNIFYEVNPFCTSIVAENSNGTLYHARNMDFGIFLGWDVKSKQWAVTESLKPLLVNVDYQQGGKTVAKAVHFAGYIGVITGVKPGVLTMTMNARHSPDSGFLGFLQWIMGRRSEQWTGFFMRDTLMEATDYATTKTRVVNAKLMAPAYIILGGTKTGEGSIIVIDREKPAYVEELDPKNGKWFLVQTNYDPTDKPPFYDDRRTSALKCMTNTTQKAVGLGPIYNVLSTKPNLNLLTTYSALMQVNMGYLETFLRECPQPCYPW
ncbi:acid ceramidase-like isoform X2 [Acanthaster planci]|uniref:Acid ceramidase n=1 Tax=Acanthaster planci TaxID=133434 RepID=A0A8B7ZS39_ACAPL|nr:acid ceramidase-like isoform X2 [Acanthaster planci]